MNYPKISVVIPSFNQGNFIERTLLSIFKQDYLGKVEIIVSDGGSTDNTVEILTKYTNRLTWWSETDKGYADAVNRGFVVATGDIFAVQSSDDYYLKDSFNKVISAFFKNPDAVLICGREALQEPNGNIIAGYELPEIITPKSFLLDHPFPGIFQHTTFFRREFFEMAGGMRSQFDMCADADLFYRMLHFGEGRFLNDYIAVYQRHMAQRTVTQTLRFRDVLTQMVTFTMNDSLFNRYFRPSDSELSRFKTFIQLFYLQYENSIQALDLARQVKRLNLQDSRINDLSDQIIKNNEPVKKVSDNFLKKLFRRTKNFAEKYFLQKKINISGSDSFSQMINASWWDN